MVHLLHRLYGVDAPGIIYFIVVIVMIYFLLLLYLKNYGFNGNLLCYHGVVERIKKPHFLFAEPWKGVIIIIYYCLRKK